MQDILSWVWSYSSWIQILSLTTGIAFMVMQTLQFKWMWYFGLITSGAAVIVALVNHNGDGAVWAPLWAQVAMNSYFFVMDIVGIFNWRRIEQSTGKDVVHVARMTRRQFFTYFSAAVVGMPIVYALLSLTNDPEPLIDAIVFTLSILAQLMLTKSFLEQWALWMLADAVAIMLYASQGAWWMMLLYGCYIANAFVGVWYWRKYGVRIEQ